MHILQTRQVVFLDAPACAAWLVPAGARARLATIALLLLASIGGTACKGRSGGGGRSAEGLVAAFEEARPMYDALAAIRGATPAVGALQAKPCPLDELKASAAEHPYVLNLTWNDLVEATGEEALRTSVDAKLAVFSSVSDPRVARIYGPRSELWKYPDPVAVREAFERFRRFAYAAIVYPTVVREPTHIGDTFEPGAAEAWVLVFRIADAALLCAAPVHVENDESIGYSYEATKAESQEAKRTLAIAENLKTKLRTAIPEVITAMTGGLR